MWVITDELVHTKLDWWDQMRVGIGDQKGTVFLTLSEDDIQLTLADFEGNENLADTLWEALNDSLLSGFVQFSIPGWIEIYEVSEPSSS